MEEAPQKPMSEMSQEEFTEAHMQEKKETAAAEREKGLRENGAKLMDAVQKYTFEIQRRAKNEMDPFYEPNTYRGLQASAFGLQKFLENKDKFDTKDLQESLTFLGNSLEKVERLQTRGAIREDERSLGRLAELLRDMRESVHNLEKYFDETDGRLGMQSRKVKADTDRVFDFMVRLRSAIRNYR